MIRALEGTVVLLLERKGRNVRELSEETDGRVLRK